MAFYINGGNGLVIGIGDSNRDGKIDLDVGLRSFGAYGNGWYGSAGSSEIGFNTARGAYVGGSQSSWTPWSRQSSGWRTDNWGTQGGSSYGDVYGNYSNNGYARDVFGNYSNNGNAGNVWSGANYGGASWGNVWTGQGGGYVGGHHGHRHWNRCGGYQAGGWFGGGCF